MGPLSQLQCLILRFRYEAVDPRVEPQATRAQSRRARTASEPSAALLLGFPVHQVALLRAQLALERKQRQDYIARSVQTSRELAGLHHSLSHSLLTVAQAPEATVLEAETRKLDESLSQSLASPEPVLLHPSLDTAQTTPR